MVTWNKHCCLCRSLCKLFSSNYQVVKNDVTILTSRCDLRSDFFWISWTLPVWLNFPQSFRIVNGNDNALIALKNYAKITVTDCHILEQYWKKINSRNKTNTISLENKSDMCQYFNSSGFPLKFRSLNLKCFFSIKTITKKCQ